MQRISPEELLKDPWVLGEVATKQDKDVLKKMREWNSKRKLN